MIATLQFDLTDEQERISHFQCVKAEEMANVLFHMNCNVKQQIEAMMEQKGQRGVYPSAGEVLDAVFEQFNHLMETNGLNINEITN